MTAYATFYPLGNADSTLLELANKQLLLIDFGNQHNPDDPYEKRCDLAKELRAVLRKAGRNHFDVVCFTHLDDDHCQRMGEFFWLRHSTAYQGEDRVEIDELWVPACALTETNLDGDARLIRQEARHRLREKKGIRIFSRADRLKSWMEAEGMDFESRKHLFVDAGKLVPGFAKDGPEAVEFFVHSPFAWRQDETVVHDRNGDSIVFQAVFVDGGEESYALFGSDVDHTVLAEIVNITRGYGNDDRLRWDLLKLFHHCSYLSLGPDRGLTETVAVPEVKWLFETQGQNRCTIVSPSKPIPLPGSLEDKSTQPPHRQAANHHRRVVGDKLGTFMVTMDQTANPPKPLRFEIDRYGIGLVLAAPTVATAATSKPARQG
ncbi:MULTISPECIES: hypothetical protein [unclassified Methylobacterium]|jgi:hypothetical protein|uniref:hypothetical protein n=1 Tax=unclassified Methylobacterium TaxID=2615210 RepID=UPI0005B8347E|nr:MULTISPECIES: hypothetical protein [unclassified Methylobacterium]MCJ2046810.1 hypothetical protein [Methylobacterium sp. J-078]SFU94615.1 hypothetical protein SAMN02799643_03374 [Methylobacterium sp. UNCCL125]